MKTYVHIFDNVKQDWQAVAAIIENTLTQVKLDIPAITEVFLRSDNAGCYKCASLLTCITQIERNTGD